MARFLSLLIAGAPCVTAGAQSVPPLRVLLQPSRSHIHDADLENPKVRAEQTATLFLQDWLASEPRILLVDEPQARCILSTLTSRAIRPPQNLFRAVQSFVPVQVCLLANWSNGVLALEEHRSEGCQRVEISWPDTASASQALRAIESFVANRWGLNPDARDPRFALPWDNPSLMETLYLVRRFRASWVQNSGEAQLGILRPFLDAAARSPRVAEVCLQAAVAMADDPRPPARPGAAIQIVLRMMPVVWGTASESAALAFLGRTRHGRQEIEKDLLERLRKATQDAVEAIVGSEAATAALGDDGEEKLADESPAGDIVGGVARSLGILQSVEAVPMLESLARSEKPAWREAAVWALGKYGAPTGRVALAASLGDAEPRVAFAAACALRQRGEVSREAVALAETLYKLDPTCDDALNLIASDGGPDVAPLLLRALESVSPTQRVLAVRGLLRLGGMPPERLAAVLGDVDGNVVRAALADLPPQTVASQKDRIVGLANHPDPTLAESARLCLSEVAPTDSEDRLRFELAVEHYYVRRRHVAALAEKGTAGLKDLAACCSNADPWTRAYALERVAAIDRDLARTQALRLLADDHRYVRLQAAAVLASAAKSADAPVIRTARATESDGAVNLYLEEALACAEKRAAPQPRPPANRVPFDRVCMFLCGHGTEAPNTPFQGYYDLRYNPDEAARRAHAAGKIFLARANRTAPNPAQILLDPNWRDAAWMGLEDEFGDLAALDGIVLGEESMYFRPFDQWENGWRLFCREAGLDPRRIAGRRENLTDAERKAWWRWEQRVAVEGFNVLYHQIKLRFGILRPGFQVCTFMPDQNGPCDFDREWKFDIGAGYYYETNNRHRYTQIRRFRTLWPDRPVIWLCDGTPRGLHTPLNFQYTPVAEALVDPNSPVYADAICAWIAGANPGYFYARLALAKDVKPGPAASGMWVFLEEFAPRSGTLTKIVDHVFRGVEANYQLQEEREKAHADLEAGSLPAASAEDSLVKDLLADGKSDPWTERVRAERERLRLGLLLERKWALDCARLLADLPLSVSRPAVLLVGDMRAETGALCLPSAYDALDRPAALEGQDLAPYRLVALAGREDAEWPQAAATNLLSWLERTPGLLYIHGWLGVPSESTARSGGDNGPPVMWPWICDVLWTDKSYTCRSAAATPCAGTRDRAAAVVWAGKGCRGRVLFDDSDLTPDRLSCLLRDTVRTHDLDVKVPEPIGMEALACPGIQAIASCARAVSPASLQGVDLLTGVRNPVVLNARMAAWVPDTYLGTYAAAHDGVGILAERPLVSVQFVPGGLRVTADGLVQASAAAGKIAVQIEGDVRDIGDVKSEEALSWILESDQSGIARVERSDGRGGRDVHPNPRPYDPHGSVHNN